MRMYIKLLLPVVAAVVCIGVPQSADAYRVLDQNVTQLTNTTTLYTISFGLGFKKYETSVPIRAQRDTGGETERSAIAYHILSDTETVYTEGEVHAIVLSDAEIENGMYRVPRGESTRFTLVALVTRPEAAAQDESGLALGVSYLPFDMTVVDGVTIEGKLNDSELQYYRAPQSGE